MKNLKIFSTLLMMTLVLFSACGKEEIEEPIIGDEIDGFKTNITKENINEGSNAYKLSFPLGAYDLVDHLNSINFTRNDYIDCEENLQSISFYPDPSSEFGSLASNHHDHLYSGSEYIELAYLFKNQVKEYCDNNNAVIVDVAFDIVFATPIGDYFYEIIATATVCCQPNLENTPVFPSPIPIGKPKI